MSTQEEAFEIPESHQLWPWLKSIGYKNSTNGSEASLYAEDIQRLCDWIEAYTAVYAQTFIDANVKLHGEMLELEARNKQLRARIRELENPVTPMSEDMRIVQEYYDPLVPLLKPQRTP